MSVSVTTDSCNYWSFVLWWKDNFCTNWFPSECAPQNTHEYTNNTHTTTVPSCAVSEICWSYAEGALVGLYLMLDCAALMVQRLVTAEEMRTRREMKEEEIKRDRMETSWKNWNRTEVCCAWLEVYFSVKTATILYILISLQQEWFWKPVLNLPLISFWIRAHARYLNQSTKTAIEAFLIKSRNMVLGSLSLYSRHHWKWGHAVNERFK